MCILKLRGKKKKSPFIWMMKIRQVFPFLFFSLIHWNTHYEGKWMNICKQIIHPLLGLKKYWSFRNGKLVVIRTYICVMFSIYGRNSRIFIILNRALKHAHAFPKGLRLKLFFSEPSKHFVRKWSTSWYRYYSNSKLVRKEKQPRCSLRVGGVEEIIKGQ